MVLYSTLEFDSLKRCPRCKTVGNLNLEREDSLSMENGKLQVNKGALVYHCRACGCNSEVR